MQLQQHTAFLPPGKSAEAAAGQRAVGSVAPVPATTLANPPLWLSAAWTDGTWAVPRLCCVCETLRAPRPFPTVHLSSCLVTFLLSSPFALPRGRLNPMKRALWLG